MPSHHTHTLRGVDVEFPFKPYDCQLVYMEKVIHCLQDGTNALLESPTGTGKTLCLLCATLGWRQAAVALQQMHRTGATASTTAPIDGGSKRYSDTIRESLLSSVWNKPPATPGAEPEFNIPKIIYSSRTHSQLAQAIKELQNTTYKPTASIIGSREQMCIHPEVSQITSGTAQIHSCRKHVAARLCSFYNNLEKNKMTKNPADYVMDIEDLTKFGESEKVCPYYLSRQLQGKAEIIFMPYNYLIDPVARAAQNLDLANAVVIFDEAHNLERVCEEAASFDLTSLDIATAIGEVQTCHDLVQDPSYLGSIEADELLILKALLLKFEQMIASVPLSGEDGFTAKGDYLYTLFDSLNLNFDTKDSVLELLDSIQEALNEAKSSKTALSLTKFADALRSLFSNDNRSNMEAVKMFYKVHIQQEQAKPKPVNLWSTESAAGRTVSFWCFSPGFAMRDLLKQGVRSIILTSGTLSPLSSFAAEMQLPFPITLENPHVISKNQLWCGIVSNGPNDTALNSSFKTRSDESYLNDLGSALINYSRVVPDGLLVFFPSYSVMTQCIEHWQRRTGNARSIWDSIHQFKYAVVEPRDKSQFPNAMNEFYAKIKDPTIHGAVFFAVCRGKVSEGLDFADMNGRAVVVTGIPYPALNDARVKLKKVFLDEMMASSKSSLPGVQQLSGAEWYKQVAARAVNQAIGRVIRHRADYGAILLCDARFSSQSSIAQLPLWVRPYVKTCKNFGDSLSQLSKFFKSIESDPVIQARAAERSADNPKLATSASTAPSHTPSPPTATSVSTLGSAFVKTASVASSASGKPAAAKPPSSSTSSAAFLIDEIGSMTSKNAAPTEPPMKLKDALFASMNRFQSSTSAGKVDGCSLSSADKVRSLADRLIGPGAADVSLPSMRAKPIVSPSEPQDVATGSRGGGGGSALPASMAAKRPHLSVEYDQSDAALATASVLPAASASLEIVEDASSAPSAATLVAKKADGKPGIRSFFDKKPEQKSHSLALPATAAPSSDSGTTDAKVYMTKCLDVLEPLERSRFSAALSAYRRDTNVEELAKGALVTFLGSDQSKRRVPRRVELLQELRLFVKVQQRSVFDELIARALGSGVQAIPAAKQIDLVTGATGPRPPKKARLSPTHTLTASGEERPELSVPAEGAAQGDIAPMRVVTEEASLSSSDESARKNDAGLAVQAGPAKTGAPGIICPVCLSPPTHPFTARCGHVCCLACWDESLKRVLECPVCRRDTRMKQLTKLFF